MCRIQDLVKDEKGLMRTAKVLMRPRYSREKTLPYASKKLVTLEVRVQRLAMLCPVDEIKVKDTAVDDAATPTAGVDVATNPRVRLDDTADPTANVEDAATLPAGVDVAANPTARVDVTAGPTAGDDDDTPSLENEELIEDKS